MLFTIRIIKKFKFIYKDYSPKKKEIDMNHYPKIFSTVCLLILAMSCQRIPTPDSIVNSDGVDPSLEHTCESCHSNKTILTILAQARGEAGGGG